ncbi:MAG: FKBP-type peptidyl-prolyl cis-trans isomerase [Amphiplicatus sp.]
MRMHPIITAAAVAAVLLAGCGKKEAPSATPEEEAGQAQPIVPLAASDSKLADENRVASEKFLAENAKKDGVKTTASGLQYKILSEGPPDGFSPKASDVVTVEYVGALIDGSEFDSSRAHGAAARFPLDQVIPGWTEGVQLMSEGDRYRFYIPSDLAYGETGTPNGPIGPNAALIFDVELLDVTDPERNAEEAKKFLAENAGKEGVKTTGSGLQYQIISEGPAGGASPSDANIVKVHYKGTLTDGTEFDSSYARGEPAEFPLGRVIPGWTEGVQLMSVGDKYRFFIPPSLGYGEQGSRDGSIGPNEALIFEVELLDVK